MDDGAGLGSGEHGPGAEEHPGPLQQLQALQEQPQGSCVSNHFGPYIHIYIGR